MHLKQTLQSPLRAVIALLFGLIIYHSYDVKYSYWIVLTIVVLLQSTTGATLQRAMSRIVGTIIGVLLGFLLIVLLPVNLYLYIALLLLSLFLAIISVKIHYALAMFFAGILIALALGLFSAHGDGALAISFVIARIVDTIIAGFIVIITSYVFWPDKSSDRLLRSAVHSMTLIKDALHDLSRHLVDDKPIILVKNTDLFYREIKQLEQSLNEIKAEPSSIAAKELSLNSSLYSLHNIYAALISIVAIVDDAQKHGDLSNAVGVELQQFLNDLATVFENVINMVERKEYLDVHKQNDIAIKFFTIVKKLRAIESGRNKNVTSEATAHAAFILLTNVRTICIQAQFFVFALRHLMVE